MYNSEDDMLVRLSAISEKRDILDLATQTLQTDTTLIVNDVDLVTVPAGTTLEVIGGHAFTSTGSILADTCDIGQLDDGSYYASATVLRTMSCIPILKHVTKIDVPGTLASLLSTWEKLPKGIARMMADYAFIPECTVFLKGTRITYEFKNTVIGGSEHTGFQRLASCKDVEFADIQHYLGTREGFMNLKFVHLNASEKEPADWVAIGNMFTTSDKIEFVIRPVD